MKQSPLIIIAIIVAVLGGGALYVIKGGDFSNLLKQRHTVPSPIAACTPVNEDEARQVAQTVTDAFNALEGAPIDAILDLETLFGEAIHQVLLSDAERRNFLSGALNGARNTNNIPARWIQALGSEGRVRLLRIRQVDGHQRAQLRMLVGEGLNYLDLLIVRTPAGTIRVVDYQDMATGEFLSRSIASVAIPALAGVTRTPLERLVQGSGDDYVESVGKVPELRKLMEAGKHQEAMDRWHKLPEKFRTTRAGTMVRMQIAQELGEAEHLASLQEIERLFPNDPALSLVQVDANSLAKRYPQAQQAIDRVDDIVGGDPYLDSLRASVFVEAGDLAEAQAASTRACEREPELIDNWWTRISISLTADTHAQTAMLLDEIRTRFGTEFQDDLPAIPEYARFGKSPEYAQWLARQKKPAAAASGTPAK